MITPIVQKYLAVVLSFTLAFGFTVPLSVADGDGDLIGRGMEPEFGNGPGVSLDSSQGSQWAADSLNLLSFQKNSNEMLTVEKQIDSSLLPPLDPPDSISTASCSYGDCEPKITRGLEWWNDNDAPLGWGIDNVDPKKSDINALIYLTDRPTTLPADIGEEDPYVISFSPEDVKPEQLPNDWPGGGFPLYVSGHHKSDDEDWNTVRLTRDIDFQVIVDWRNNSARVTTADPTGKPTGQLFPGRTTEYTDLKIVPENELHTEYDEDENPILVDPEGRQALFLFSPTAEYRPGPPPNGDDPFLYFPRNEELSNYFVTNPRYAVCGYPPQQEQ